MAGFLGGIGNFLGSLFGKGGGNIPMIGPQSIQSPANVGGMGAGLGGVMKNFLGGDKMGSNLGGLATIFGSQMLGNPKPPSMPDSFNQFMSQMNAGGTPGMQSANQYYQGVLSGQNQGAYDASTFSLDQSYEEELRRLNSMYKSLRPGTDPSSDSTYQRDLNLLNQNYAQNRANVRANVQQGAAQGLGGLGAQQMGGQMAGIQAQVDQIASQWGMNYAQRDALRKQLMGLGAAQITGPQMSLFGNRIGGI